MPNKSYQNKIGTKFLVLIGIYAVFNLKTINILMEDKITYKIYSMNAIEFSKCYSIDYARSKPFLFLYFTFEMLNQNEQCLSSVHKLFIQKIIKSNDKVY